VLQAGRPDRHEVLALTALAALVLSLTITPITNNDIFLHLKTGELVLSTGEIPRVDDYSALAVGRPFVAHEWLSGVLFRLIEGAFGERGLDALIGFKAVIALSIGAALYATARIAGASPLFALPSLAFVMILAAARIVERPHIFGYLLTALFLLLLGLRRSGHRRIVLLLLPLQIVWANLHGSFLVGPMIVALAAAAEVVNGLWRRSTGQGAAHDPTDAPAPWKEAAELGAMAILLIAACLLNPYGWGLLRFPFELTGSSFMTRIYEWIPPYRAPFVSTYMFRLYLLWAAAGIAALTATAVLWRRRRTSPPFGAFPILLFLALFVLSLRMNRNVTDFALATFPGVAAAATWALRRDRPKAGPAALRVITALLLLACGWFAVQGYAFGEANRRQVGLGLGWKVPVGAADYLERNDLRGNVFNTYAAGAYLVYRLYPAVRVGMDSRNDVYGEALYEEYLAALRSPEALRAMLQRIDASIIVLEWPKQDMVRTAQTIHSLGGWRPVYFDDAATVYLHASGPSSELAARDGYRLLDPALFAPGALPPEQAMTALAESERAVREGGGYVARVMRIEALARAGRMDEALADEARILSEAPPREHIYAYLGYLRLAFGDPAAARDRFRRALRLNPGSPAALQGMKMAERAMRSRP
jgi:tetratricopeptide (TPR) repeat protein